MGVPQLCGKRPYLPTHVSCPRLSGNCVACARLFLRPLSLGLAEASTPVARWCSPCAAALVCCGLPSASPVLQHRRVTLPSCSSCSSPKRAGL